MEIISINYFAVFNQYIHQQFLKKTCLFLPFTIWEFSFMLVSLILQYPVYQNSFGLVSSIIGAHSMGKLEMMNSLLDKYPWTNDQEGLFNNQMLRNYAQMPQYSFHCTDKNGKNTQGKRQPIWVGNATGIFGYPTPLIRAPPSLNHRKDTFPFKSNFHDLLKLIFHSSWIGWNVH